MSENSREHGQGWRLRSGWVANMLRWGNNPHPAVMVKQTTIRYWNFNAEYGGGELIYYDCMRWPQYVDTSKGEQPPKPH